MAPATRRDGPRRLRRRRARARRRRLALLRRDGEFVVHTDGPDGTLADFPVAYTFGVRPLQQYLIAQPGGRFQALTLAWDTERGRWFDLYPGEKTPPGDVLHWTGRYQSWNGMCASCHSTNLQKNYDARADRYATTWSEINVSCQSCHGPGERHVASARSGAPRALADGLVDLRTGEREIEVCAACHSRRAELSATPVPGAPLYDDYLPALLTSNLYHADGQQLGEVYEYGSFRQSRMYQAGVRCTDCHDAHRLTPVADGNALCVRCHQDAPDTPRFPGLRAKSYDSPGHHFHAAGSPGARCVACHMPARNYMVIDARRDHAIRIPRPDLTVKIGTPNACSGCHADRTPGWAADAVARWYGPARRRETHYGEALAAGRTGRPGAEDGLVAVARDAAQPAIVRATALDLLRRYGPASIPASVAATHDPDPAVRIAAVAGLERVPPEGRLPLVAGALRDPLRAVRIEAARVLSSVRRDASIPRSAARTRARSRSCRGAERRARHAGPVSQSRRRRGERGSSRRRGGAVPERASPRPGLHAGASQPRAPPERSPSERRCRARPARRHRRVSRKRASSTIRSASSSARRSGCRKPRPALGRAADLLPERARVRYNYALALEQLGRDADAAAALAKAREIDPGDPDVTYSLAIVYVRQEDWRRARQLVEQLAELSPADPRVTALMARIEERTTANHPR
jgi:hypothetical protein